MPSSSAITFDAVLAAGRALAPRATSLEAALGSGALEAAWADLSPLDRAVLSALVGLGGAAPMAWLAQEAAAEAGARADEAEIAAVALWERGLLSRQRSSRDFFVVDALGAALVTLIREGLVSTLEVAEPPPPAIDEHVLACAFNVARHDPIRVTRDSRPHRRSLDLLRERLAAFLPADANAWLTQVLETLRSLGLLVEGDGALTADPAAGRAWARLDAADRQSAVIDAGDGTSALLLLRQLQEIGADRRVPRETAARLHRRAAFRLLGRDARPEPSAFLAEAPARFAAAAVALERAGLVVADGAGSLTLTVGGRSFPAASAATAPTRFHVGGDHSVLVPRGLDPRVHLRVGTACRLESGDVVARYRLDRALVMTALDDGETLADLVAFLDAHAEPRLPAAVRDDLGRWAERFGEVSAHEGIVLACRADERREEFDAVASTSQLSVTLVSPGVAVVAPGDHEAFHRELVAAGFTPRRRVPVPEAATSRQALVASLPSPPLGRPAAAAEWAALPAWGRLDPGSARRATPPPSSLVVSVKHKYRREFGGTSLSALDRVDVDELLEMEESGRTRQFLAGATESNPRAAASLDEYVGEPQSVTPARARQVLEQAAAIGARCHLTVLSRPGGRRLRLVVEPIELRLEAGGGYLLAKNPRDDERRLIALDRIVALSVLPARR